MNDDDKFVDIVEGVTQKLRNCIDPRDDLADLLQDLFVSLRTERHTRWSKLPAELSDQIRYVTTAVVRDFRRRKKTKLVQADDFIQNLNAKPQPNTDLEDEILDQVELSGQSWIALSLVSMNIRPMAVACVLGSRVPVEKAQDRFRRYLSNEERDLLIRRYRGLPIVTAGVVDIILPLLAPIQERLLNNLRARKTRAQIVSRKTSRRVSIDSLGDEQLFDALRALKLLKRHCFDLFDGRRNQKPR